MISEWAINILLSNSEDIVILEGYAMGASKGLVFNIAENGGLLKHKMWKNKIKFDTPSPGEIKKFFNGKGNAKKEDMYQSFLKLTGNDLSCVGLSIADSPICDIVDSFAMYEFGKHKILLSSHK